MSTDRFDAFPVSCRETMRAAFTAAFGSAPIDAVTPVSGGATSAFIFRIEVRGRHYLMRAEGLPSPLRNPHQYASMRIAAEAGIAPKLLHIDEAARVAVMDFIEPQPLISYPGGRRGLARALGELLAHVQTAPLFPHFVDYPDIVARLFAHVRRTGLLAAGLLDAHVERLDRVRELYLNGPSRLVSSHNDPNLRNILFDGERLWLIDWESAYRNDFLVDVAIVLDCMRAAPDLEDTLLQAWCARSPDEAVYARLEVTRALTRLYYAGVLLSAAALEPRTTPESDLSAPTPAEFHRAIREGRLRPGAPQTVLTMGKMYLAGFLSGLAVPGLDHGIDDG
jgi:aminoglycoside phosphotransferase (APT) family kinase protein